MKPMVSTLVSVAVAAFLSQGMAEAKEVIKTGIATPQSQRDYGNNERLRQRALRDAMELALMETGGAEVMAERGSLYYSRETIRNNGRDASVSLKQRTAYHRNARTRLRGSVRLLEILREWWEGERYLVRARLEVSEDGEWVEKVSPGSLWRQAGRPAIRLEAYRRTNGREWEQDLAFERYLEQQLALNQVETTPRSEGRYLIEVRRSLDDQYLYEFGTWKTLCELSFVVEDQQVQRKRSVHRLRGGPAAGFSRQEAEDNCLEAVSSGFSRKLMESLLRRFNDEWINGRDFSVALSGVPPELVGEVRQIIADTLGISALEDRAYREDMLYLDVAYKGTALELAEAITLGLDEAGMKADFQELRNNRIRLVWRGRED